MTTHYGYYGPYYYRDRDNYGHDTQDAYYGGDLYLVSPHDEDDLIISLEDMKKHLRVDFDDDDDTIEGLILGMTSFLSGKDGYLGRALLDSTWELRMRWFPCNPIRLPLPPLIEVTAINYFDKDGNAQTFDMNDCTIKGVGGKGEVWLNNGVSWPVVQPINPEAVVVQFRAGYVDSSVSPPANKVPPAILAAIKLHVGTLYENRETVVVGTNVMRLPDSAEMLLSGFKEYR